MEKRIPIIIDCDPGHDDAMAIPVSYTHLDVYKRQYHKWYYK